jgi:hypothetical protein
MVRHCMAHLLGLPSHAETTAMRGLGFTLSNLTTDTSTPVRR